MEKVLEKLSVPFWVIAIVAVLILATQAYSQYWHGKLAKAQYKRDFESKTP